MSAQEGKNICPKQAVWDKKYRVSRLEACAEKRFLRFYVCKNFSPTGQKTKPEKFQELPKGASPGELLDVTFDTSFGSFVICDITSDCGLVLSLCDQAGKGVEMVRVFQSSG